MEIKEIKIPETEDIIGYILNNCTRYDDAIFRGQSDCKWEITSTLSRNSKNLKTIGNVEKYQMSVFKKNILGINKFNPNKIDENLLWSIGQHHGLFTPLIDWTKSPFVALFFALQDKTAINKKGSIFCIHTDVLKELQSKNKLNPIEIIEPLDHTNKRIISQSGVFTKIPQNKSIEEIIKNENGNESELCYKILFSTKEKDEILKKLDLMQINERTMFPDIHGAAMKSNRILMNSTDQEVEKIFRGLI